MTIRRKVWGLGSEPRPLTSEEADAKKAILAIYPSFVKVFLSIPDVICQFVTKIVTPSLHDCSRRGMVRKIRYRWIEHIGKDRARRLSALSLSRDKLIPSSVDTADNHTPEPLQGSKRANVAGIALSPLH